MRKVCFMLTLFICILMGASPLLAKTSDQYVDDAYQFINQRQFSEALTVIREGLKEYPGDIGLVFALAECYHNLKDYDTAVVNYLSIMNAIGTQGKEAPGQLHHNLVDAYNEIGQKHYFSEELCLRIIYHSEKVFELTPVAQNDKEYMEFLRKSLGHYDVAKMGAKMMETGGDGAEFQLPNDNISIEEKLRYKDKAIQRLKEYNVAKKESAFRTIASDKSIEDIAKLINQRMREINSIHFKKINSYSGTKTLIEEVIYKSPDKLKAIQPNAISIISNNNYYVLDPQSAKVTEQMTVDSDEVSFLKGIELYNLKELQKYYNLTIEKIIGCPDFLKDVCSTTTSPELYLITGKLKDKDKGPYPPTPKVEYFIDTKLGLFVAIREYWIGVLGSGKEEDLAKEIVVTQLRQYGDNLYLPLGGTTRGLVEELSDLKENWTIEVISLNKEISDKEFSVPK